MYPKRCAVCYSNIIEDGNLIKVRDTRHRNDDLSFVHCHERCVESALNNIGVYTNLTVEEIADIEYDYFNEVYVEV